MERLVPPRGEVRSRPSLWAAGGRTAEQIEPFIADLFSRLQSFFSETAGAAARAGGLYDHRYSRENEKPPHHEHITIHYITI
ncbi:unnamed protein product [Leptosia nina]|uniref:Uncharacterized protein n=1 Tax=Leptosia nina TaxID=320188 RepID=A0AAV1JLX0_9NEOP